MGTRGKGLTNAILGSAASELARDSSIPVLLVGERPIATTCPASQPDERARARV